MNNALEYRAFSGQFENDAENRRISGYAALYSTRSQYIGFYEIIAPGAFDNAIAKSDVRCLFNHDPNLILGRTKSGTLRIKSDDKGLYYEVDVPDTPFGESVFNAIKRGDVSQSSFGFFVDEDRWFEERIDGKNCLVREILKIKELFDVSPVTYPAYHETSVSTRANNLPQMLDAGPSDNEELKLLLRKKYFETVKKIRL